MRVYRLMSLALCFTLRTMSQYSSSRIGPVMINNRCSFTIWVSPDCDETLPYYPIDSNTTGSFAYIPCPNGYSYKIGPSNQSLNIIQVEETVNLVTGLRSYDQSWINAGFTDGPCTTGNSNNFIGNSTNFLLPFGSGIYTSNSSCSTVYCAPGDSRCSQAYLCPDDNWAIRACSNNATIVFVACWN